MKFFERYNDNFSVNLQLSADQILRALKDLERKRIKNIYINRFVYGDTYKLSDNIFEIRARNTFLNPLKGVGKITMKVFPDNNSSKVLINTTPLINDYKYFYAFIVFFIFCWTIFCFLISSSVTTVIMILTAWISIPAIMHLSFKLNKLKLKKYSYLLLQSL